jgi:acyl-CoA thioesterase
MNPTDVVNHMLKTDAFSNWLGIEVIAEMLNGLGIVHGGIAFSLADSAFAFACNNRNNLSVALDTSINFIKAVHIGDTLIAEAIEMHNGKSTGIYHITITNQNQQTVALFKGTCFRTGKPVMSESI